ncbi:flagellar protein [Bermanella marisrubri]|uniref:Flagellar protein FliL n=1 Tax=Bermanella marisrubri TaxID=207949 RepID=Q1N2V7_9GAMM|nr:flagellar basal body-associated FliL family protein [Bermanella marisrubri]EAT12562.1 Flagellar basal body-associated protein FliL [Oceanobacter sp. RED65] [Bermanella marisrubri]QIZ84881.1 flagellar protein [Bermanella marisrubri]
MANEKELQIEGGDEQPAKSKKMLIIIIVAAILVIGGGVGVTLFLLGGDDEVAEEAAVEGEEAEAAEAAPPAPAIYVKFKPEFIVNYQVGPRQRYLQIYMEAMTRDPAIADALEQHSPMIRSSIINLLSQQDYAYLRTAEGRANLRDILKQEVQRLLAQETGIEDGLKEILFTNFVMQ